MRGKVQMKIALISDIHGNFSALKAVTADIKKQGAEQIIFLGDAATIGPQPLEVIDWLREIGCPCILGNHDEALLQPARADELQIAPPLVETLHWCREQLSDSHLDFLRSFHSTFAFKSDTGPYMLCYHGTLESNTINLFPHTPAADLDTMTRDQNAKIFVGGHTHIPMHLRHQYNHIINPGSVGCPFAHIPSPDGIPRLLQVAQYTIVERNAERVSIDLRNVQFDTEEYCAILEKSTLPIKDWWLSQFRGRE